MGDDGKHLNFDPIKLIKTSPRTILSQTIEKSLHYVYVHGIRTIKDETLHR